jgi:hypothetical protein
MEKLIKPFLLLLLVITVFHAWFLPGLLSTFDFPYYSPLMMKDASIMPYAWGFHVGLDGFARFISPYSWVLPFINIPQVIFGRLGMDWGLIERITYLYPLLILLLISPVVLFKTVFPKNKFYLMAIIVFSFNTYSLLLFSGEIFVALAYCLIPLILAIFIKILSDKNAISKTIYSIAAGLVVSLQIMFDPRVAYVTLSAVALYAVFSILYLVFSKKSRNLNIKSSLNYFVFIIFIPGAITLLLQAFWILPSIFHGGNPVESLGAGYSSVGAVQFLSFAKLENTITLLHPNWPENIFGKVYFMRPEFLLLPVLAFASLFFIKRSETSKEKVYILFFALLGLVGTFLAKGSNDPFGGIYLWMFNHIPGFIMFRDPAKWYLLVAISYSILIPFSMWKIYEWLSDHAEFRIKDSRFINKNKIFNMQNIFVVLVVGYLLFLIRPALLGQLGGTFKTTTIPAEYTKLEQFLSSQNNFSRTLWVPSKQRFGFYSNNHPEMSAQILFNITDNKQLMQKLDVSEKLLQKAGVRYVIVPYDSQGEIFLSDRKYDNKVYLQTITQVKKIPWLIPISGFGKIAVFALPNAKGHFYITNQNSEISYKYISPVEYSLSVTNAKKGDIVVFAESFDGKWVAETANLKLKTEKYDGRFNSFILPGDGDYSLRVYYTPQDYVNIGVIISIISFVGTLGALIVLVIKKK